MYLRITQRHNKNGSVIRYLQLAHNRRDPATGHAIAHTIHNFGREDQLDRAALRRLAESILRYLHDTDTHTERARTTSTGELRPTRRGNGRASRSSRTNRLQ